MKKTTRLLAALCALMLLCACAQADDLYATETGYTSAPSDGEYSLLMWQSQESEGGLVISVDAACALMRGNKAVWEQRYGGDGEDELCWAVPGDGVWTAAGSSASADLENGWHEGYYDVYEPRADGWLVQLSAGDGEGLWSRCYGGSSWDGFAGVCAAPDGGYLLVGHTFSVDGDLTGLRVDETDERPDAWAVRVDAQGAILWQRCFGGTGEDAFTDVRAVDGGYMAIGYTGSADGTAGETHGDRDGWAVLLSDAGEVLDEILYGGTDEDSLETMTVCPDGKLLLAGFSWSKRPENTEEGAYRAGWALLVDAQGALIRQTYLERTGRDRILSATAEKDGTCLLAGESQERMRDVSWVALLNPATGQWQEASSK